MASVIIDDCTGCYAKHIALGRGHTRPQLTKHIPLSNICRSILNTVFGLSEASINDAAVQMPCSHTHNIKPGVRDLWVGANFRHEPRSCA